MPEDTRCEDCETAEFQDCEDCEKLSDLEGEVDELQSRLGFAEDEVLDFVKMGKNIKETFEHLATAVANLQKAINDYYDKCNTS